MLDSNDLFTSPTRQFGYVRITRMNSKVKIVNHPTTKTDARCTEPL